MLWQILGTINDVSAAFMPFFLLASSVIWISRERSIPSIFALVGGLLASSARVAHWYIPSVTSASLGNYPEPAAEQNPFTWFMYVQALNIGVFMFVLGVGGRFVYRRT